MKQDPTVPRSLKTRRDRINEFDDFMLHSHLPGKDGQVAKYQAWERTWSLPNEEFRRMYQVTSDGCWEWLGEVDDRGLPILQLNGCDNLARRVAWIRDNRMIYRKFWVVQDDLKCTNPRCIAPEHSRQELSMKYK